MKRMLATVMVVSVVLAFTGAAFAAEVTGKVEASGANTSIKATSVKADDGTAMLSLAGKTIKVVGTKSGDVAKLVNKKVVAKGTLKAENTEIDVTSVSEAPAPKPVPPAPTK
ncbi:MAG TPA: hypothetical protein PLC40_00690 [Candidatus Hydrogenedentes bacterium]|nr:MAG: hypothetical protein BWY09_00392 [Candidatus Hydrogenedentes bacterium ADurb.Bin179]HOH28164.1 hypothetical protein [Candidatus Hydrogenedentota bacterium]